MNFDFSKEPVYIIIPVHNRKLTTLNCLKTLETNGDLQRYHVIVIDDGSTDGTTQAIESLYPEVVILAGDGNLWWTGAIKKGMEYAYQQGAEYFIWLNDDTLPSQKTIFSLVSSCDKFSHKIVSGQCYATAELLIPTYGGQKKKFLSLQQLSAAPNQIIECDCMNGNLVCLPRSVVDKIGFPDSDKFPQTSADVVYTWQAKQVGFQLETLGNATAVCEFNFLEKQWLLGSIPMKKRWEILNSPKSNFYPYSYWKFCQIFYGQFSIICFIKPYIKMVIITLLRWIFPSSILKQIKTIVK
ncbi:MAG TPA: glycosyltransferase family 2 protein [Cyanothece sp. UBA12306]|nr:glycosyltransferase family 2 protein [Cyanothece sp. UBA12306]